MADLTGCKVGDRLVSVRHEVSARTSIYMEAIVGETPTLWKLERDRRVRKSDGREYGTASDWHGYTRWRPMTDADIAHNRMAAKIHKAKSIEWHTLPESTLDAVLGAVEANESTNQEAQ